MKSDQARPAPRAHRLRCLTTPASPLHNGQSLRSNFKPQIANPNSNWSLRLCPANPWIIGSDEKCYRIHGPRLASHSPVAAQTRSIPIRTATTRQSILGQIRPAFVTLVSFCKMSCPRLSPTFRIRPSHATPSNIGFSTRCYRFPTGAGFSLVHLPLSFLSAFALTFPPISNLKFQIPLGHSPLAPCLVSSQISNPLQPFERSFPQPESSFPYPRISPLKPEYPPLPRNIPPALFHAQPPLRQRDT